MSLTHTERQARIVSALQNEWLSVKALAKRLKVSVVTVHRDLRALTRGGVRIKEVGGEYKLAGPPVAVQE